MNEQKFWVTPMLDPPAYLIVRLAYLKVAGVNMSALSLAFPPRIKERLPTGVMLCSIQFSFVIKK